MGQYFRAVNIDTMECLSPFEWKSFAKLMEHSYYGNPFVNAIWYLLANKWNGHRVVWSGDYSDTAMIEWSDGIKSLKPNDLKEYQSIAGDAELFVKTFAKDYLFVNYSKEIYCHLDCCEKDIRGWRVNPVPLLLANSNGRGGGDYRLENEDVGSWAYDSVGIIKVEEAIKKGFVKVDINFPMD